MTSRSNPIRRPTTPAKLHPHRPRLSIFLSLLLLLSTVSLARVPASATSEENPSEPEISETDLAQLHELVDVSPRIRNRISAERGWKPGPVVLHRITETGEYPERTFETVRDLVRDAVRASGRYESVKWTESPPVKKVSSAHKVVRLSFSFNGYKVTDSSKKDRLLVRLWVCPDTGTANLISWLRRGNQAPTGETLKERQSNFQSHELGLYFFEDLEYGEIAYGVCPNFEMPALPATDHRSFQSRGFQRKNLVVEASTRALFRSEGETEYKSTGPDYESWKEIDTILQHLDDALKKRRRP